MSGDIHSRHAFQKRLKSNNIPNSFYIEGHWSSCDHGNASNITCERTAEFEYVDIHVRPSCNNPNLGTHIDRLRPDPQKRTQKDIFLNDFTKTIDTRYKPGKYPDGFKILNVSHYDKDFCYQVCTEQGGLFDYENEDDYNEEYGMNEKCPLYETESKYVRWFAGQGGEQDRKIQSHCLKECKDSREVFSFNFNTRASHMTETRQTKAALHNYYIIMLDVRVASRYITVQEIRQAKTVIELIAEIGGLLGLLVGVSLISLIDTLEFLFKFCQRVFKIRSNLIEKV